MSMGISNALAAAPTSGSVTVNPNFESQTYTLYKLFDAHITFNDAGEMQAITYTIPGKGQEATDTDLGDGTAWFHINDNGFVEANDGVTTDWAKDKDAIAWALSFGTAVSGKDPIKASKDNDPAVKWDGLDFGYYFVKTTLGSFIGINSNTPDVTIADKNSIPSVDKSITGVKDSEGAESGSVFDATEEAEKADVGAGKNEQAIAQVGDTVSYEIKVVVKPGAKNYVISDTMTGLALVANSVKVDNAVIAGNTKVDAANTTVEDAATSFTITLSQDWLDTVEADTTVTITYDAVLTDSAVIADAANPNTVTLTWGDNPNDNHDEDGSKVWTAKVDVFKQIGDDSSSPLAGAGFKLKKDNLYYKYDATDGVTWVAEADADELTTGADGKFAAGAAFKGLANGSYTLVETTVPAGYNKMEDTPVTIAGSDVSLSNLAQTKTVKNNAGTVLPSTGGIGTTIFYVVGSIMVVAAGVLLVTKKRMSREG